MPPRTSFTPAIKQKLLDAGTFTGSGPALVGGVAKDFLHGRDGLLVQPYGEFRLHIRTTAVKTSFGDERYRFIYQLTDDPTWTAGLHVAAILELGHASVLSGDTTSPGAAGYRLLVSNEVGGLTFARGRLFLELSGTAPSISVNDVFLD